MAREGRTVSGWSLACPRCRTPLPESRSRQCACERCHEVYLQRDGIWRMLPPGQHHELRDHAAAYREVRSAEGWGWDSADPYRRLPECAPTDPRARLWRRRRASFERLVTKVLPTLGPSHLNIIDLGAGNGWLANRLAERGHTVAAVDVSTDPRDGLGALRHYDRTITKIQADFDRLPFADDAADVALFNGSLHHSRDPATTLAEAARVVGLGHIVVMDSPVYRWRWSGERMLQESTRELERRYGTSGNTAAVGFVTFHELDAFSARYGIPSTIVDEHRTLRYLAGRMIGWLQARREPARMPLVVFGDPLQKPAVSGRR